MGWESFSVVGFDLRISQPKSAYNSLIIGPRGLQSETNLQEIMG